MGLRIKKRTKGKNSWINYSLSKKGPHASASVKISDDITYNFSSRGTRTTINFGDGISYVHSSSNAKKKTSEPKIEKPKYRKRPAKFDDPEWVASYTAFKEQKRAEWAEEKRLQGLQELIKKESKSDEKLLFKVVLWFILIVIALFTIVQNFLK